MVNAKRGLALACSGWAEAQAATGATWLMDWGHAPASLAAYGVAYVPMARRLCSLDERYGLTSPIPANPQLDTTTVLTETAGQYPGRYWLIGNEPDLTEQDNYWPRMAVRVYSQIGKAILTGDSTAKLILGGCISRVYMTSMLDFWPSTVPLAGLQWHAYRWGSGAVSVASLKKQVQRFIVTTKARDPAWEVWVSEWGVIGFEAMTASDAMVVNYIAKGRAWLEQNVNRHAYFTWTDDCMGEGWPGRALKDSAQFIAAYRG